MEGWRGGGERDRQRQTERERAAWTRIEYTFTPSLELHHYDGLKEQEGRGHIEEAGKKWDTDVEGNRGNKRIERT
jgi:hypothetical protein